MSATRALSAAPPCAILTWTDGHDICIELPGPGDGCTVLRYPLTVSGYQSALGLIRNRAFYDGATPHARPSAPRTTPLPETVYDNARAVLRQLRVIR